MAGAGGGNGGEEVRECVVCKARPKETFLCSGCFEARYCSSECQKAHWKQHRKRCKELKAAAAAAAAAGEASGGAIIK